MGKKYVKEDGMYVINGKKYKFLEGTRAQVFHETAFKTSGGLLKKDLLQNKNGRIVSKSKHTSAKKEKNLEKHGYFATKGKFGFVKKSPSSAKKSSKRTTKKAHSIGGKTRRRR
tara:strand:+ start:784 stop:1125 length:342 start_codon:yes stop_codon:yes gene_type:complete